MRIAVWNASGLPPHFTTGVGKHFIHVVDGLARAPGNEVVLFTPRTTPPKSVDDPALSPLGHVPVRRLPWNRRPLEAAWRVASRPAMTRWARGFDWLYTPRELWCPPGGMRYALTVHDLYAHEPASRAPGPLARLRTKVLARALRRADVVLAVSEFTKSRLMELFGVQAEKIAVVFNGAGAAYFAEGREPSPLPDGVPARYVLAVGGLRAKKGAEAQLRLAEALAAREAGISLLALGPVDPPYVARARACRRLVVLDRGIPNAQVEALTRGAVASVMLSEYEGFGIPLVEAMAAGVPAIGARRASLPEVLGPGGLVVDPMDAAGIAGLIVALAEGGERRAQAVAHGRERARLFTWEACVARVRRAMETDRNGEAAGA